MSCKIGTIMLGIFVVLIAVLRGATAQSSCDCYQTDSGLTFLNRAFNDFRQVSEGKLVFPAQPPVPGPNGDEPVTSPYFDSEQFSNWGIQSWNSSAGPVDRANSRQNVYISSDNSTAPSHLTLRTVRTQDYQSISELNTVAADIIHGSFRYRARVNGNGGACAGFFTYKDDNQESDIEILTNDAPSQFHATNQPGSTAGATTVVTFPGDRRNFGDYRLDWQDGLTEFYFNNASLNQNSINAPNQPGIFDINLWSDGGSWSGVMAVGNSAFLDIEYIDMYYNTTSDYGRTCSSVCKV